jgi:hypothetical protein
VVAPARRARCPVTERACSSGCHVSPLAGWGPSGHLPAGAVGGRRNGCGVPGHRHRRRRARRGDKGRHRTALPPLWRPAVADRGAARAAALAAASAGAGRDVRLLPHPRLGRARSRAVRVDPRSVHRRAVPVPGSVDRAVLHRVHLDRPWQRPRGDRQCVAVQHPRRGAHAAPGGAAHADRGRPEDRRVGSAGRRAPAAAAVRRRWGYLPLAGDSSGRGSPNGCTGTRL